MALIELEEKSAQLEETQKIKDDIAKKERILEDYRSKSRDRSISKDRARSSAAKPPIQSS